MVEDLQRTAAFYTDVLGLRRHPKRFVLEANANPAVGGMEAVFIDGKRGLAGIGSAQGAGSLSWTCSRRRADGHLAELCVEVDNLDDYGAGLKAKGVEAGESGRDPVWGWRKGLCAAALRGPGRLFSAGSQLWHGDRGVPKRAAGNQHPAIGGIGARRTDGPGRRCLRPAAGHCPRLADIRREVFAKYRDMDPLPPKPASSGLVVP